MSLYFTGHIELIGGVSSISGRGKTVNGSDVVLHAGMTTADKGTGGRVRLIAGAGLSTF